MKTIALLFLLFLGMSTQGQTFTVATNAPAKPSPFPEWAQSSGSWDVYVDTSVAPARWTALGSVGQDGCTASLTCLGVPGYSAMLIPFPALPSANFCVDTMYLGTKQPQAEPWPGWAGHMERPSLFVLTNSALNGQPALSARFDSGVVHLPGSALCWPHGGQPVPMLRLLNNWDTPQIMTLVIGGELR